MGRHFIRCISRIYFRTSPIQYLYVSSILTIIVNEIDFASYADDNTPFVSGDGLDDVLDSLENASLNFFEWFSNNQMQAKSDRCHLLTSATASIAIKIKDNGILNSCDSR